MRKACEMPPAPRPVRYASNRHIHLHVGVYPSVAEPGLSVCVSRLRTYVRGALLPTVPLS